VSSGLLVEREADLAQAFPARSVCQWPQIASAVASVALAMLTVVVLRNVPVGGEPRPTPPRGHPVPGTRDGPDAADADAAAAPEPVLR
jgi:hypothetical protein